MVRAPPPSSFPDAGPESKTMRVFLASIPLEAAKIVIIGGGEPALAKLRLFLNTPAQLLWFAPDGAPPKMEIPLSAPEPVLRAPQAQDLAGARLVFMALDDADELTRLSALARAAGARRSPRARRARRA